MIKTIKKKTISAQAPKKAFNCGYYIHCFADTDCSNSLTCIPYCIIKTQPRKYIDAYIQCLSEKNWDEAYNFMPSIDSPYINKESFKQFIEANSVDTLFQDQKRKAM